MQIPGWRHRRATTDFCIKKSEYKIYLKNKINLLGQSIIFSTTDKTEEKGEEEKEERKVKGRGKERREERSGHNGREGRGKQ